MSLADEIDAFCRSMGVSTATFDRMIDRPGFVMALRMGDTIHPRVIALAKRITQQPGGESPAILPSDEWGDPMRGLCLLDSGLGLAARAARRAGLEPAAMQLVSLSDSRLTFASGQVFGAIGELRP